MNSAKKEKRENPGLYRVPTRTGKPGKMGRHFPVREKSGKGSHSDWKTWKNGKAFSSQGKVREF